MFGRAPSQVSSRNGGPALGSPDTTTNQEQRVVATHTFISQFRLSHPTTNLLKQVLRQLFGPVAT